MSRQPLDATQARGHGLLKLADGYLSTEQCASLPEIIIVQGLLNLSWLGRSVFLYRWRSRRTMRHVFLTHRLHVRQADGGASLLFMRLALQLLIFKQALDLDVLGVQVTLIRLMTTIQAEIAHVVIEAHSRGLQYIVEDLVVEACRRLDDVEQLGRQAALVAWLARVR